jgi:hypothetical protein
MEDEAFAICVLWVGQPEGAVDFVDARFSIFYAPYDCGTNAFAFCDLPVP